MSELENHILDTVARYGYFTVKYPDEDAAARRLEAELGLEYKPFGYGHQATLSPAARKATSR